jgi:hypothetical protein
MKKVLLFLLTLSSFYAPVFAQVWNYSGFNDTARIDSFQSTGSKVSKAFNLSQYEEPRFSVLANDTANAGYSKDSIFFVWGIQLGNYLLNASGLIDTTWQGKILIDTFNMFVAGNKAVPIHKIDTVGKYNLDKLYIDTANITGYAVQDRSFNPEYAPLFRFWCLGFSPNQSNTFIKLRFAVSKRVAHYFHQQ